MLQHILDTGKRILLFLEETTNRLVASLLIGLTLLLLAALYVQPSYEVAFHGIAFSDLSLNPFDFSRNNPLHYRILAPLIGYFTFLRGPYFFLLPLVFLWCFISIIYFLYRKKYQDPVVAFLIALSVTMTSVVFIPLSAPGYTDTVTFFFLFLAVFFSDKIILSVLFFLLCALNHESAFFFLPAVLVLAMGNAAKFIWEKQGKTIVAFSIAVAAYFIFRYLIGQQAEIKYSIAFYFTESNRHFTWERLIRYLPVASFYAFRLHWFLILAGFYLAYRNEMRTEAIAIALVLAGAFAQLIIAYDYQRMITFAFPAMFIGISVILKTRGNEIFSRWAIILFVLNIPIFQYIVSNDGLRPIFPWLLNWIAAQTGIPLR